MENIVNTYIELRLQSGVTSKRAVAAELSELFDRKYDSQRLNKWSRGQEALTKDVYMHMLREALDYVLSDEGMYDDPRLLNLDNVLTKISFPKR